MSSPHPLNLAVIAQTLGDLRSGQWRRCEAMGFTASDLEALKQPSAVSALINAQVPWCSVRVNSKVVQRLLAQARDVEREIQAIDRMLRLGASTEMISEFYGLTHPEVALRRQVLALPERKGRWPDLTEAQDAALWERWHAEVKSRGVALDDDAAMFALSADLAEEQSVPMALVWGSIRKWIEQGLV
jgi:hypothetical protein